MVYPHGWLTHKAHLVLCEATYATSAPDVPGEARRGKALRLQIVIRAFVLHCFQCPMHLALWLMDLKLGGAHGGPGNGTWLFYYSFIVFFVAHQGAASRWHQH